MAAQEVWKERLERLRNGGLGLDEFAAREGVKPAALSSRFEVVLGNGRVVRVPVGFSDSEFARVLTIAGSAP